MTAVAVYLIIYFILNILTTFWLVDRNIHYSKADAVAYVVWAMVNIFLIAVFFL